MCEIVYYILITNFTVHRCIIRSNAPSNLQMQPLGCIFVYALNCITFGTAIEPSCGVGNFIGKMPSEIAGQTAVYGVEIDSVSGRIAKQLYPDADIQITGFENTNFQNGSFDVAVGNVPFGDLNFPDKQYGTTKLHDFFFAQTLDKVKEGGIVAFVTSKGTLDKKDESFRRQLAEKADLVGAVRLPNTAFKANAGTEVTSDILFLQKRSAPPEELPEWVHLGRFGF